MENDTVKETKATKILALIILVFAINEFITPLIVFYYGVQDYMPKFLNNFLYTCYFFNLYFGLHQKFVELKLSFLDQILVGAIFINAILFFISTFGLIMLKNWARKTMVFCLSFIFIATCVFFLLGVSVTISIFLNPWWLKPLILLYPIIYLTRPKVREQFK